MSTLADLPDPTAIYIDIAYKIENEHEFSAAEAKIDFQRLFHALGAAISENTSLKSQVETSTALINERDIEIFNKDMEIFSMTTQFERLESN